MKRPEDLIEKMISLVLFDTDSSFNWYNALALTKELFIEVSMVRCSHFVIFNFLQGKVVCLSTRFQVACLVRVYIPSSCQFCLLHEDGIVEA